VILDGTSDRSMSEISGLTSQLENTNPSVAKLFIATDQEGGEVQRLQGTGFATIPSGVEQGQLNPSDLRSRALIWGKQLRDVGVTMNLAPVLDTVPANSPGNPPIGDLDREFGHTTAVVTAHGLAVVEGMSQADV